MILRCLGSGSEEGNSYLLESQTGRIAILDLGVRWKDIQRAVDFDYSQLDFALVSHLHRDHSIAVKDAVRNGIPCFGECSLCTPLPERKWTDISGWKVLPIPVKHTNNDGSECPNQAFVVQREGQRLLYMTDWQFCKYRLTSLHINHFLIAVNYSENPEGENRDHVLHGHASLDTVKDFLLTNMTDRTRSIICCHLSEYNCDPVKVLNELRGISNDKVFIEIAQKGGVYVV